MKKLLMILSIFVICTNQRQLAMDCKINIQENLVDAAIRNNWPLAELLLLKGADPNVLITPMPLFSFVFHGNKNAIQELVSNYGADIHLNDPELGAPITYAMRRRIFGMVAFLSKLGADHLAKDCFGQSAYEISLENKKFEEETKKLNARIRKGKTVALSELNLPALPITQNHKRIQRSKTTSELRPTQFPELDEHKATVEYENQEEFHPVAKTTKSKSCPQLQAHANYLTHKLQQIQLNQDGTAHLGETRFKQLQTL